MQVIELGKDSGVFVNKHGLKQVIARANSPTILGRGILKELFKTEALKIATLDGKGVSDKDKSQFCLPEVAVEVLISK